VSCLRAWGRVRGRTPAPRPASSQATLSTFAGGRCNLVAMADEHLPHDGPAPAVGVGPADQPVTGFAVAPGAATQAAGGSAPDPGARAGDDASAPPGGRPGGGAPPPDPSTPPTAPSPGTQRRGRRARPVIA